jgi:YHS domain-containing protein
MATKKDPVCQMDVKPEQAAAKSQYEGKDVYFCSKECKTEFDKEPERYMKKPKGKK